MDAAVFGLIVADLIASPMNLRGELPAPGGLQIIDTIELTTGGNVCNTGIAMAKLGMSTAAAGVVGKDVLGLAITDRLTKVGMDTSCVFADSREQTSATVVAVEPGGERCFFYTPGATKLLDAATFRKCFDTFKKCRIVQVGYFGLLPAMTADLPALFAELKRASPHTLIALDTVNPPADWSLLEPVLPHVDIFAPSRTEAEALTKEKDPKAMIAAFRRHLPKSALVGIKLDAEGALVDDGKQQLFVPAYKIKCVDTTGAGDTWFGGFLTALLRTMPLKQATQFANRAAADCCTALGASTGVKSFEDTFARL